jgi:hypothetical protein
MAEPRFTDKTLYGASGHPRSVDIEQDKLGDCYFVSPLGSLAEQQPGRLENAIKYNADKGTFTVTLYKEESTGFLGLGDKVTKPVSIEVTQAELEYNIKRQGGSTVDNNPGTNGPVWPAVMETAFAKMHDSNAKNGLEEGFEAIRHGGWPRDALFTLTGVKGETVMASDVKDMGTEDALKKLGGALADHRPVMLSTTPENTASFFGLIGKDAPQDGLADNHAYMVEKVYKDKNGDVQVQVRNPWGTNMGIGEGHDTPNASFTVKLKDIMDGGGLGRFDIGPAPSQKPTLAQADVKTGDPQVDTMLASLSDPAGLKQSMQNLASSPAGQQFAASGREQFQEQQNREQQAALTVQPDEATQDVTRSPMRHG